VNSGGSGVNGVSGAAPARKHADRKDGLQVVRQRREGHTKVHVSNDGLGDVAQREKFP